ncbi:MAG: FAD-dependent oxidoreductase [Lachnospiraceae bacterium]|nr:FAD-dependent oxidoreductase [Lachnospiraceae bacterium]
MQIKKLRKKLLAVDPGITAREADGCLVLEGETDEWSKVVKAGRLAVDKKRYLGVVNDIRLKGYVEKERRPAVTDDSLEGEQVDVLIIGAGISGAAAARECSRYRLKTLVIEKGGDVAVGQSSRNGGVVHTGISFGKKSLKLKYCLRGNEMYTSLSEELDVPLERPGQIMFIRHRFEVPITRVVKWTGDRKGIPGIRYLNREKLAKIDPAVPAWAIGGLHMASGGITCPYKMTIALAENAAENGVRFSFETMALGMKVEDGRILSVQTNRGTVFPKVVINAAGTYADRIARMAEDQTFTIHPRKGSYLVVDKKKGHLSTSSMGKAPYTISPYQDAAVKGSLKKAVGMLLENIHSHSKGIAVIHTIDNNILLGPEAIETPDRESTETDRQTADTLMQIQHEVVPEISRSDIITYFSGVRSASYEEDFVVRQGIRTRNIFEMAAIQSPGVTAAPAIAVDIVRWAVDYLREQGLPVEENEDFRPKHRFPPTVREMPDEERDALIRRDPDYGEIVCRCEEVSRGEIRDALRSSLPVYTLDAVKRRVRPGMGRCQGGFCTPEVLRLIAEASGMKPEEIAKSSTGSEILKGPIRPREGEG